MEFKKTLQSCSRTALHLNLNLQPALTKYFEQDFLKLTTTGGKHLTLFSTLKYLSHATNIIGMKCSGNVFLVHINFIN